MEDICILTPLSTDPMSTRSAFRRVAERWRQRLNRKPGADREPGPGDLTAEFRRLGPWTTKFVLHGREYGGWFDGMNDGRIQEFRRLFPNARRILELGSLEGGHTLGLSRLEGVTEVVGLEGRQSNLARAQFVKRLFGIQNVSFQQTNLEEPAALRRFGIFDVTYCCGLLYHLPHPWELLNQIAEVARGLYLSTHYCPPAKASVSLQGYQGRWFGESGMPDPLSGLSRRSFWPTRECLLTMLHRAGFDHVADLHAEDDHPNGPIVTLAARQ